MNPQYSPNPSVPGATGTGGSSTDDKITQAKQAVSQTARDAASKVKTVASDAASRAKAEAERLVLEKKEAAATKVGGYSNALHESAQKFEEQDPNIAHFTHQAADRLQSVADYIRNRDLATLRDDCCGIARNHPTAFFGGLFVAGLLIGNMMKATARPRNNTESEFDDSNWRSDADQLGHSGNLHDELPMSSSPMPSTTPGMGM